MAELDDEGIRIDVVRKDEDFLADCFSGDEVICDKGTLHEYLLDQTVSGCWWGISDARRRALGHQIIEGFGSDYVEHIGTGDYNCESKTIETHWGGVCHHNAIIRCCKIGFCPDTYSNEYYYNGPGAQEPIPPLHCYTEEQYNLPCFFVKVRGFHHAITALQVEPTTDDWDSWIFFQYEDTNIRPGNWQMPFDDYVGICATLDTSPKVPPPFLMFYIPKVGKPTPVGRNTWLYVGEPMLSTDDSYVMGYEAFLRDDGTYVGIAEANGNVEEGEMITATQPYASISLNTSSFPLGTNVMISLKRVGDMAKTLDSRVITIPAREYLAYWICPWCGFQCNTTFELYGHVEDEHTPCVNTEPSWAINVPYCIDCGMNFIGGTNEGNHAAYLAHHNEFKYIHTQADVIRRLSEEGRASKLPIYWLDPPSEPGYVNVIPTGYYIYIDRQYAGHSPRAIFCGPNRKHEIRLINTSNTILLDKDFTVGEGQVIDIGKGLPDIILDMPTPAPLPPGTCRVVIPTVGYTATVEGHCYTSPLEFFIPIGTEGPGHFTFASGNVKLTYDFAACIGTLKLFKVQSSPLWTVDIRKTTECLLNRVYDYIPTEEGVVLVMKPSEARETVTKEGLEKQLSTLNLKDTDWGSLTSCTPNWVLSSRCGTIAVMYEEPPIQVDVIYSKHTVSVEMTEDGRPIWQIDKRIADQMVTDITETPPILSFTASDFGDTEGLMLYANAIAEWEKAIAAFPNYYSEFINRLGAGYDIDKCVCQLNYEVLRPLTHWIETPTFIDPDVDWFYEDTEAIYKSIVNCNSKACVKEHLDSFYSKMLQLYDQFPTIKVPYFTITSEYEMSAEVQEFDGTWHVAGTGFKSLEVKINEEGPTNVKFYSIQLPLDFMGMPKQPPTTVQYDIIEAGYEGTDYTFEPIFEYIYPCPFLAFIKGYTTEYNIELYGLGKEVETIITGPGVDTSDRTTHFSSVTVKPLDVGELRTGIHIIGDQKKYLTFTQPIYTKDILHLEARITDSIISGRATIDVKTYEPYFSLTFWDGAEFDESIIDTDPPNIGTNYGWNTHLGEIGLPLLQWELPSDESGMFSIELPYIPSKVIVVVAPPGFDYDKPFVIYKEPQHGLNGTVLLSESAIPRTLYQRVPSTFGIAVLNTGAVLTEYKVSVIFIGLDVVNEEMFWSDWSSDVAPNESAMLPVLVELSEEAIPTGAETAEYNIFTKLVAR